MRDAIILVFANKQDLPDCKYQNKTLFLDHVMQCYVQLTSFLGLGMKWK